MNEVEKELQEEEVNIDESGDLIDIDTPIMDDEELENNIETDSDDETDDESNDSDEDSEITVTIGDEDSPPDEKTQKAPSWVKELRKTNRELKRQNRELNEKMNSNTEIKPVELGKKPTLEDVDYDSELYDTELQGWYDRKVEVDKQNAKAKDEQLKQEEQWKKRLEVYNDSRDKLKVVDYDEAEFIAQEKLSKTQQGMIVEGADNPALLIYALGKNPRKLEELSGIKQPVKFAFTISKLEAQLKVNNRKRPTSKPEKRIQSSSGSSNAIDSTLDRLRDEAAKTGNFTKVVQYKNQLKNRK